MVGEVRILVTFQRAQERLKEVLEMPEQDSTRVIRSLKENGWHVSGKLKQAYPQLEKQELAERVVEALARLLPLWSISYRDNILKPETVFGNDNPLILEIGFGMGETTQKIAQARPDDNFLGVEVFNAGVGALLKRIDDNQISNIRIIQHDAVEVVRDMIAPASLAGIHIYFPDPWPKKRHHKRRLVQSPFIQLLTSRLKPGGYIHCATDWENYAEQMLEVLSAEPMLSNTHDGYAPRPDFRPLTKFENRGLRLGHGVWDLIFTRNDTPTPELNWPKKE
uniref:tRNA (guanine(46)-N(7))-methyltransferase n=1 Tax=Steinernema glaseri TaxID=37863 RepID=A0A1I7Y677_9BILA